MDGTYVLEGVRHDLKTQPFVINTARWRHCALYLIGLIGLRFNVHKILDWLGEPLDPVCTFCIVLV